MTADEISDAFLKDVIPTHEGIIVDNPREVEGYLAINEFVALPLEVISSGIAQGTDIEISDQGGNSMGTLCFCRSLGNALVTELTIWQYVAFLSDAEPDEIYDDHYSFKRDYVVLETSFLMEYIDQYFSSAPLWGKFSHTPIANLEHTVEMEGITAIPGIRIASQYHQQSINRYLHSNNPFERFLRIYQSIELLFDYVLVRRIKLLDDNISGFSQIYADFGRSEIDRLRRIMKEFCSNPVSIASSLEISSLFKEDRHDIFFKHNKSGNPFSDASKWEKLVECLDGHAFNASTLKNKRLINKEEDFPDIVIDLASYWIYRIRCSIAHNRVGEFVLQDSHRAFVAEFAEPLVLEAAKQIFANPDFASL